MVLRFLLADALSLFGNAAAAVVLPWLVLVRTGDPAAAGLVAAAAAVPSLLAAIGGGVLIDRLGRRRMSVVSDLGSAAAIAALPVVDAVAGLGLGWFVLLAVVGALFDAPGMTAREALLPDVARAAGVPVSRVSGLREATAGAVLLAGPGIGAGLLAFTGGSAALWLTAGCSFAAALVTATLPAGVSPGSGSSGAGSWVSGSPVSAGSVDGGRRGPGAWAGDLVEGWRVLRRDRVVAGLSLLGAVSGAILVPLLGLILPVHLAATSGPGWLGATITATAIGGLVGAGLYAAVGTRVPRRVWFAGGLLVQAAGLVVIALLPAPWLLVAGAVLAGAGSGPLPAMMTVILAERVPDEARGRVLGLQNAALLAAAPLGLLGAGLAVDAAGVATVGRAIAAAWCLITLVAVFAPGLRDLGAAREVAGADHR